MIRFGRAAAVLLATAAAMLAGAGGLAAQPPPAVAFPVLPPPSSPRPAVPPRPMPPLGAVSTMTIPALDASGVRQTVNTGLTPAQAVWNLRAAMNVAALHCLDAKYQPVLDAYKALLKDKAKALAATNRALDQEFKLKYGAGFRAVRDAHTTQVYNYFALPPAIPEFCEAALAVANETLLAPPADLDLLAAQALPRLEQVFENFFRAFDQYRADAAAWDAQYAARFGMSAAGSGLRDPLPPVVAPPSPLSPAGQGFSPPTLAVPAPAPGPAAPPPLPALTASPAPAAASPR